jgi:hypothetical protein
VLIQPPARSTSNTVVTPSIIGKPPFATLHAPGASASHYCWAIHSRQSSRDAPHPLCLMLPSSSMPT